MAELGAVLQAIGADVRYLSLDDCPPASWPARALGARVPLLLTSLAARRLARSGALDGADVVLSIELMGSGVRAPRHLHLFFGSYTAFREDALAPVRGGRAFVRAALTRLARTLENTTQGPCGAIANSAGLRDRMRAAGVRVRQEIVPPPTDTTRFSPRDRKAARERAGLPQDRRLMLFAGRWEYAKGADRAERVLEHLPPEWSLVLATPRDALRGRPLPPDRTIPLLDVPHERMADVYASADVLIQPSRFEGYSLVVSEAQACGCPVLTSPVGHAEHLLKGEERVRDGVVLEPDDPSAWRRALERMVGTPRLEQASRAAARAFAEDTVSHARVSRQWYDVLSSIFPELAWQRPR